MESTNFHQQHHQLQVQDHHQLVGSFSSSLASPCFSVGEEANAWRSPSLILNNSNIHATSGDDSLTNPIVQDLGFHSWVNNNHHDQTLIISNKIKQESSSSSSTSSDHHHNSHFPHFSDMLSPSTTSPSEMLLLKTLSPTYKNHMLDNNNDNDNNMSCSVASKGITTFSQIFPSVNISKLSNNKNNDNNNNNSMPPLSLCSSSMEMSSLQGGFDLFATTRLLDRGDLGHPALTGSPTFGVEHDLQVQQRPRDLKLWNSTNNLSSFNNNEAPGSKTDSSIVEPKSTDLPTSSKKPRFESRASCPPLKVRKEKLGDRIAALQQLVAPFGKTDTASVLMEAIGYIKFLQNQVETLSVPYMKLSKHSRSANNAQQVSDEYFESGELKSDLQSRGLCLVPVSFMSYLASDAINGCVWPSSNFNPNPGGF